MDPTPRRRGRPSIHGASAGGRRTPTYLTWQSMLSRCRNPGHPRWEYYGGRGITVCERWSSFEAFLGDMGERPDGTWIERVDNSRGYEPGNCRWATPREQAANRRERTLPPESTKAKALAAGMPPSAVYYRLRSGWPLGKALSEPLQPRMSRKALVRMGQAAIAERDRAALSRGE